MRLLDHKEYSSIWLGMWWAMQTVTTVGYGDVTPKDVTGRLVAALVMLEGVAFVAIVTAAVTSTFVARAERERDQADEFSGESRDAQIDARFDDLSQQLERLEAMVGRLGGGHDAGG